jgi:hypothetical protein
MSGWTIYPTGFRSSQCCGTVMWRICQSGDLPDRYVCDGCKRLLWERNDTRERR